MKKILVNMIFLALSFCLYAQNDGAGVNVLPYDSTVNFFGEDVQKYIGQELYLKGLSKSSQPYGYSGFILKYKKNDDLLNDEKNIYKPNGANYTSRYEDLAGKYFQVLDVIKHTGKKGNGTQDESVFFKLQEKSNGDILYYNYNPNSEYTFPFILTGFFLKEKERLIGQDFVVTDDVLRMSRNIVSGKALIFTTGQIWKCIDFDVNEDGELSLLLQSSGGIKTSIPYALLNNNEGIRKVYTATEASLMKKKYNENNYRRILQNKVRVGMTKEMTRLAWGEPIEIVLESGKKENWVYPSGSLLFNGDKIISTK